MKKAGLTLAIILAGCSLSNAPETRHVESQPAAAQQAVFSNQSENYALIHCDYTLTMDTWGYTIECSDDFMKIKLDHSEWAPGSVVYDGKCNERLFYESEYGKQEWIDYDCDSNVNAVIEWIPVQREGYDIFVPNIIDPSTTGDYNGGLDFLKTAIGAEKADAAWRFRYHVQNRNNGGN
ncbi:MAG: hypothetical protein WC852_02085 [Candidatus Nanoarchaeia archaeon]